jgi:nitrite reductase (NADH) small subunit
MTATDERPGTIDSSLWTSVCRYEDLEPERGAAALVGGQQVAVFRLDDGSLHAVDHLDPFSGAHVMARGIVGSRGETPTVASPMYKQVFDLRTGECLDASGLGGGARLEGARLRVFPVRLRGDVVEIGPPAG